MKRLLKILRSRFFLAAFCIVLEFTQLMAVFILLYEFFLPITVMRWIFHVCVLLYLINRDYRSLVHHFECGAWMYDTECIGDMKSDFLATAAKSQIVTAEQAALRGWKRLPAELMKVFSPLL